MGGFKSFVVEGDEHYWAVSRYVERNALRARLVKRAEDWRWGSLWRRVRGEAGLPRLLSAGPLALPDGWVTHVNQAQSEAELEALRLCVQRGRPYGRASWVERVAAKLGLQTTLRPRGRPRKTVEGGQAGD
jgi:putative transposase